MLTLKELCVKEIISKNTNDVVRYYDITILPRDLADDIIGIIKINYIMKDKNYFNNDKLYNKFKKLYALCNNEEKLMWKYLENIWINYYYLNTRFNIKEIIDIKEYEIKFYNNDDRYFGNDQQNNVYMRMAYIIFFDDIKKIKKITYDNEYLSNSCNRLIRFAETYNKSDKVNIIFSDHKFHPMFAEFLIEKFKIKEEEINKIIFIRDFINPETYKVYKPIKYVSIKQTKSNN